MAFPKVGPEMIFTLVVSISESGSESLSKIFIILELATVPSTIIESSSVIGQSF